MRKTKRGFTLIELLVVLAIAGLLFAILSVALTNARNKGREASIISNLSEIRKAAALSFHNDNNYSAVCAEIGGTGGDSTLTLTAGTDYKRINDAIDKRKGGTNNVVCNESASSVAYVAWVELIIDTTKAFCVDSTNQVKTITKPVTEITACP